MSNENRRSEHRHKEKQRVIRGIPDQLWNDDFKMATLAPDRSAALRTYMEHVTGASQELLHVAPAPEHIPAGPILPDGIPEDAALEVQAALLSGLHTWLTGRLPPPSWSPDDILDSLERLVRGRIPQGHYIGYAEDSGLDGREPWGVWPESH